MSNCLLIDIGNSRIKWAYSEAGAWLQHGVIAVDDVPALQLAVDSLPVPAKIVASCVADESVSSRVCNACARWNIPVEFISSRAYQCGVRNSYDNPEQLGSDRWAALIAAWHAVQRSCLVVNSGTATTIDTLSDAGVFRGGLILPGLNIMQTCLATRAARIGSSAGGWSEFPTRTADAIVSGSIQATAGAICQQHALLTDPTLPCLLSGGAADILLPHLKMPAMVINDMVLRGIQLIVQESEI